MGKKEILLLLELFCSTKGLAFSKGGMCFVCYCFFVKKNSAVSEHLIFHLSLLFAFLKNCQMDILEPEILYLSTMRTKDSEASPATCLRLKLSSPLDVPMLKRKCMTTFWTYWNDFGCQW